MGNVLFVLFFISMGILLISYIIAEISFRMNWNTIIVILVSFFISVLIFIIYLKIIGIPIWN